MVRVLAPMCKVGNLNHQIDNLTGSCFCSIFNFENKSNQIAISLVICLVAFFLFSFSLRLLCLSLDHRLPAHLQISSTSSHCYIVFSFQWKLATIVSLSWQRHPKQTTINRLQPKSKQSVTDLRRFDGSFDFGYSPILPSWFNYRTEPTPINVQPVESTMMLKLAWMWFMELIWVSNITCAN